MTITEKKFPRKYLELIINRSIDPIVTIDERGIVEYVNPATTKLFGYSQEEMIGNNISMLMPSPDRENHDQYMHNYLTTGHKKIIGIGREVTGLTKDGRLIPVRLAVSEAWVDDKRIFIGTLQDLTEIKEVESRIRHLNKELESKVADRTEELAKVVNKLLDSNQKLLKEIQERKMIEEALRNSEEELRQALEKEKELSELKSRFVTMASHEFRTPLTSILSSADLIEAYTKDPEDKRLKHVGRIRSSVNNMITILNDFLSLSKLEENRVEKRIVSTNLEEFVKELKDEMHGLLKEGQSLECVNTSKTGEVFIDRNILKNILYNLLSNAIKYSPEGKPIFLKIEDDGEEMHIEVTDQGIGIPEEDQQFLFTRFFRAKNVENIQGTGLGLNIVKRYIQLMDGDIKFESTPGKGTSFFLKIPLKYSEESFEYPV
ncbi:MAG: PAS domain-containing sensor histidine kinase [Saprospirales bacterium]|nr:PAS domain-containing sensor histidine kinase [Saprospirales bacterium]